MGYVTLILVILAIIGFILSQQEKSKNEEAEKSKWLLELERQANDKKQMNEMVAKLTEQYGTPTVIIKTPYNEMVFAFEESFVLVIKGQPYNFSDIIGCELYDKQTQIYLSSTTTTKTSTGSMLGRTAVGGVLLGPVGAVIGGVTAKTKSVGGEHEAHTIHDYKVIITINSISNPQIVMEFGGQRETADKIISLLTVIIERNKS